MKDKIERLVNELGTVDNLYNALEKGQLKDILAVPYYEAITIKVVIVKDIRFREVMTFSELVAFAKEQKSELMKKPNLNFLEKFFTFEEIFRGNIIESVEEIERIMDAKGFDLTWLE